MCENKNLVWLDIYFLREYQKSDNDPFWSAGRSSQSQVQIACMQEAGRAHTCFLMSVCKCTYMKAMNNESLLIKKTMYCDYN